MARGGRFTGDVGNDGDNVDDGENDGGDAEDKAFDEDKGNRCVRLADQLRLTAESLAAFLSSVDRFLTTPSSSYPPCSLVLIYFKINQSNFIFWASILLKVGRTGGGRSWVWRKAVWRSPCQLCCLTPHCSRISWTHFRVSGGGGG